LPLGDGSAIAVPVAEPGIAIQYIYRKAALARRIGGLHTSVDPACGTRAALKATKRRQSETVCAWGGVDSAKTCKKCRSARRERSGVKSTGIPVAFGFGIHSIVPLHLSEPELVRGLSRHFPALVRVIDRAVVLVSFFAHPDVSLL
jgi:hypothetical protein